jgi:hypothetical protein
MHIMNSRFADDLGIGYKQCSFEVSKPTGLKRCHRSVKVGKDKEDSYCGRHQKRQKLERDPIDTVNNKFCLNTLIIISKDDLGIGFTQNSLLKFTCQKLYLD